MEDPAGFAGSDFHNRSTGRPWGEWSGGRGTPLKENSDMKYLVVPIAALAIAVAAQADTISYAASGYANAGTNATGQPLQQKILLAEFDPARGWLQSMTLSYSFSVHGSGDTGFIRINPSPLALLDENGTTIFSATSGHALCGDPSSPAYFTCDALPITTGTLAPLTDKQALKAFIGTGKYQFTYVGEPNVQLRGNVYSWGVKYNVAVTYDYLTTAPAPEPASWALMVTGFGAIGAAMRRRKPVLGFA